MKVGDAAQVLGYYQPMLRRTIFLILLVIFPAASQAAPALWQVDTPSGRFWLLGSIHVGKADNSQQLEKMLATLPKVTTLVQELSPDELSPKAIQSALVHYGILTEGKLSDHLSAEAYRQVSDMADDYGLPMAQLDRTRPWFALMTLMQAALAHSHYDPSLGIDNQVAALARQRHWPIKGLETAERQFKALAASDAYANDMVSDSAKEMDSLDTTLSPMLSAWEHGKLKELNELCPLSQGDNAANRFMHDSTLKARNIEWVPKLLSIAQQRNSLVVVGLGHIICQDNLLGLLKAQGASVQRLQ
ncbi:MAG: TraB/GumN family protein [Pseudomonadota bacterium]|uniref:Uncharacterized protein YbaP (TraB family) n=2 Tax=Gallaecimonas pentaromativorans TaxID=584787 RepID=A0A3N1P7A6_9GAMM|nr:TraB/GumN family protein [Gallaecimonas pentaromativorans]MED5525100.1 TraB/GumN family protein [Pseudomonadota bacterium]ROQ22640.1 uncharacterized protein YbaP (TraB family) [Gallaecimonas pentaromativorans]